MKKHSKKSVTLVELMIATGISTLIIGASLTLLLSGKASILHNEGLIQSSQQVRTSLDRLGQSLRLTQPSKTFISDQLGRAINANSGTVINFQIPVGSFETNLDLYPDASLRWGSNTQENTFIAYSIDINNNLIESTYTKNDASDAVSVIISPSIDSISFSRENNSSPLITIQITTTGNNSRDTLKKSLISFVKLRN